MEVSSMLRKLLHLWLWRCLSQFLGAFCALPSCWPGSPLPWPCGKDLGSEPQQKPAQVSLPHDITERHRAAGQKGRFTSDSSRYKLHNLEKLIKAVKLQFSPVGSRSQSYQESRAAGMIQSIHVLCKDDVLSSSCSESQPQTQHSSRGDILNRIGTLKHFSFSQFLTRHSQISLDDHLQLSSHPSSSHQVDTV